jgi:hypothetical protein
VLEGAVAGGGYGPDQARFEEPEMQRCIATLADAGIDTPAPEDGGDDPNVQPYQAERELRRFAEAHWPPMP